MFGGASAVGFISTIESESDAAKATEPIAGAGSISNICLSS